MSAPRCWGKEPHKHRKGCRRGRPLCRWRRPRPCDCGAYHYPHREGSGRCNDLAAINEWLHGPAHEEAA